MATSTLDSVLAQYEKAQQGSYPSNGNKMSQDEHIKFLEARLKHSDEQLMKAMEMLATLMSKMPTGITIPLVPPYKVTC
jgi:hypothetical protein